MNQPLIFRGVYICTDMLAAFVMSVELLVRAPHFRLKDLVNSYSISARVPGGGGCEPMLFFFFTG